MSARLVWIARCEVCESTKEFDGSLSVDDLGDAARAEGWELPATAACSVPDAHAPSGLWRKASDG